jgi:spore germination protein YaaH
VDMNDHQVRDKAVSEANWLCRECGFDGIQWDYEFAANGGTALLQLLDATRQAIPGTFVSVATPMWYPGTLWGWNEEYFRQVAQRCDQIAVMCYDSFFYLPRGYVWLIGQQGHHVLKAVAEANPRCKVLLGVPTYDEGTAGHGHQSETVTMALKGVREGLARPRVRVEAFEGIAPFAEYTTTEDEWRVYETWWLDAK